MKYLERVGPVLKESGEDGVYVDGIASVLRSGGRDFSLTGKVAPVFAEEGGPGVYVLRNSGDDKPHTYVVRGYTEGSPGAIELVEIDPRDISEFPRMQHSDFCIITERDDLSVCESGFNPMDIIDSVGGTRSGSIPGSKVLGEVGSSRAEELLYNAGIKTIGYRPIR